MKKEYVAPEVEFVFFSANDSVLTISCSPHCEVVCTDECQSETCFSLCPEYCYVVY